MEEIKQDDSQITPDVLVGDTHIANVYLYRSNFFPDRR